MADSVTACGGIAGVDTRRLTRHLRDHGAMPGVFGTAGESELRAAAAAGARAPMAVTWSRRWPALAAPWSHSSTGAPRRIVAIDLGIKSTRSSSTGDHRSGRGRPGRDVGCGHPRPRTRWRVPVQRPGGSGGGRNGARHGRRPAGRGARVRDLHGSPDPCHGPRRGNLQAALRAPRRQPPGAGPRRPARWRSRARTTTTAWILPPSPTAEVTHRNLNDGTVEGFRCTEVAAFAVQYHPEAGPGTRTTAATCSSASPSSWTAEVAP